MLPPEIIASSRGLSLKRCDESTFMIQVARQRGPGMLLFAFVVLMSFISLGFAGIAMRSLVAFGKPGTDAGGIIGLFLIFGTMAISSGVVVVIAWREAIQNWYGQAITLDLKSGTLSLQCGRSRRKTWSVSNVEEVNLSRNARQRLHVQLCVRIRVPCSKALFAGHEDVEIQIVRLGYPMSEHLAEITAVGKAIAGILKVPFRAYAME